MGQNKEKAEHSGLRRGKYTFWSSLEQGINPPSFPRIAKEVAEMGGQVVIVRSSANCAVGIHKSLLGIIGEKSRPSWVLGEPTRDNWGMMTYPRAKRIGATTSEFAHGRSSSRNWRWALCSLQDYQTARRQLQALLDKRGRNVVRTKTTVDWFAPGKPARNRKSEQGKKSKGPITPTELAACWQEEFKSKRPQNFSVLLYLLTKGATT